MELTPCPHCMSKECLPMAAKVRDEPGFGITFLQRRFRWGYVHAKSVFDAFTTPSLQPSPESKIADGLIQEGEKDPSTELIDKVATEIAYCRHVSLTVHETARRVFKIISSVNPEPQGESLAEEISGDSLGEKIEELVVDAYEIGHAHGMAALPIAFGVKPKRSEEGWLQVAEKIKDLFASALEHATT